MCININSHNFEALIFDCDGTLVDTASAHLLSYNEVLDGVTPLMDAGWYRTRAGLAPADLLQHYEADSASCPWVRRASFAITKPLTREKYRH